MHLAKLRNAWRLRRVVKNPWQAATARERGPAGHIETLTLKNGGQVFVRSGTSDTRVFGDVYVKDVYQLNRLHATPRSKPPFDTVIDIGGHIGIFATRISSLAERVISCEPMAENSELFARNMAGCGCTNVKLLDWLIAPESQEIPFYTSKNKAGHSIMESMAMLDMDGAAPASNLVRARTLAELFEAEGIERCDLLKMDCEGGEYAILSNPESACLDSIDRISMEYHDVMEYLDVADVNPNYTGQAMEKYLQGHGFSVQRMPSPRNPNHGILHAKRKT